MIPCIIKKDVKPKDIYYAKIRNYSFSVEIFDKDGKKIPKMVNGGFQYINNRQQFLEETYQFTNLQSSLQHGFLSAFYVYDDTPKEVGERLKQLDEDRGCIVENKEKYEASINPAEYKEKKEKEAIKEKLELSEMENEDLKKKVEAAQKQIAILEKMKKGVKEIEKDGV